YRHQAAGSGHHLRGVPPVGWLLYARVRRHRPGAGHRAPLRRHAGRGHHRALHRRCRLPVRAAPAGAPARVGARPKHSSALSGNPDSAAAPPPLPPPRGQAFMTTASPPTILLVEDNLHNRRIFQGVLAHAGFTVVEAEDGGRALELAAAAPPDLILMDLSIPVVDGWECTRRLKADQRTRAVPIIALTAHAMRGDEERARAAGCDGYLSKPVSP